MIWDKSFEVGCPNVDSQHKELFELVNHFQQSVINGNSFDKLLETMKFLVEYTRYHFQEEEEFMKEISYPEMVEHREKHDELVQKLTCILVKFNQQQVPDMKALEKFLMDWIKEHVLEEDKKIGQYFASLPGKKSLELDIEGLRKQIYRVLKEFLKLNQLFENGRIDRQQLNRGRVEFLVSIFKEMGLKKVRDYFDLLFALKKEKHLTSNEINQALTLILSNFDLKEAFRLFSEPEDRLFILHKFQQFNLVSSEKIAEAKKFVFASNLNE